LFQIEIFCPVILDNIKKLIETRWVSISDGPLRGDCTVSIASVADCMGDKPIELHIK